MADFYNFGNLLPDDAELEEHSSALLRAVLTHRDFRFVERRAFGDVANTIVVDCFCTGVPSRNAFGIRNRERLGLVFAPQESVPYQVRPLRNDFPSTLHQNQVPKGEPPSLCLYFQPWTALERAWTPELHLNTILWWLESCSKGELHPQAQPLEQLYFESPIHFVLPAEFEQAARNPDLRLVVGSLQWPSALTTVVRGTFVPKKSAWQAGMAFECLLLHLRSMIHARVEPFPYTLGELHDQLSRRGSGLVDSLVTEFRSLAAGGGIVSSPDQGQTLLLLDVPVRRTESAEPERGDPAAFIVLAGLTKVGEATGALFSPSKGKHFAVSQVGDPKGEETRWRDIRILPVTVEHALTRRFAQMSSGLEPTQSDFQGVLAGLGALGSALATVWTREGWGTWTFVDHDYVQAHNVARHVAFDRHIGLSKVDAIKDLMESTFSAGYFKTAGFAARVNDSSDDKVRRVTADACFLVDATTTLEVPRDLSRDDTVPRSASVFLTPSGLGSVLMLEDQERTVRLDAIEAQYYRAIIRNDWGKLHLSGHHGELWVGAGCRDTSTVIPYDLVLLHAGLLAGRVREARLGDEATIEVWEFADGRRAIVRNDVPVVETVETIWEGWTIVWDTEILSKMTAMRESRLPKETGGVVVGYYDQKLHRIYVVDVLDAPQDSEEEEAGFIRGTEELRQRLVEISQRTANIVEYIGEWHSHPRYSSAWPSGLDMELLSYLSEKLSTEGKPGLVMILGEQSISFLLS